MIAVACDHGGYALKGRIIELLTERNIPFTDEGCGGERVDYPEYAGKVCRGIADGTYDRGILICGTGLGMSIAANKYPGIRATLCADCFSAQMAREHNDANVLCLGGRTLGPELAAKITQTWLDTPFSGAESHSRRIAMIAELDK